MRRRLTDCSKRGRSRKVRPGSRDAAQGVVSARILILEGAFVHGHRAGLESEQLGHVPLHPHFAGHERSHRRLSVAIDEHGFSGGVIECDRNVGPVDEAEIDVDDPVLADHVRFEPSVSERDVGDDEIHREHEGQVARTMAVPAARAAAIHSVVRNSNVATGLLLSV